MVNIVKFAQFYCIYLLSSEQMSAGEKQIRCFYKKTILSVVILPDEILRAHAELIRETFGEPRHAAESGQVADLADPVFAAAEQLRGRFQPY